MPRTFAYLRVSTTGQTTDNQLQEIAAAGFEVEPRRVVVRKNVLLRRCCIERGGDRDRPSFRNLCQCSCPVGSGHPCSSKPRDPAWAHPRAAVKALDRPL